MGSRTSPPIRSLEIHLRLSETSLEFLNKGKMMGTRKMIENYIY